MALDLKSLRLALRDALVDRLGASVKEVLARDVTTAELSSGRFPLLTVTASGDVPEIESHAAPPVWHCHADVAAILRPSSSEADPDGLLQEMTARITASLERQDGEKGSGWWTTLGGRCVRACPSGEVEYYVGTGVGAGTIKLVMPVEIVASSAKVGVPPG